MRRLRWVFGALIVAGLLAWPAARFVRSTRMTHGGLAAFKGMIDSANAGDLATVRVRCSRGYLESHPIQAAPEGGVEGLPRVIHKNFQVWAEGDQVRVCPTDRIGPVYRMVFEDGVWKFDGLAGLLGSGEKVEASED
jgi:hypothetical protein